MVKRLRLNEPSSHSKRRKLEAIPRSNNGPWISASSTRNYMIKDPVLDYFEEISKKGGTPRGKNPESFILAKGLEFEAYIINKLKAKFPQDLVTINVDNREGVTTDNFKRTLEAIKCEVPIIYQGVLMDNTYKIRGIPDLIVRTDFLPLLVDDPPKIPSKETYVIVDIKFSTLCLRSDGVHLLNSGSFPAYKSQLWIYEFILSRVCKRKIGKAYILGRNWKYTKFNKTYKGCGCFEKLGVIDFVKLDAHYALKTGEAIKWCRDVKKFARLWDISGNRLPREELYPNMSNIHDFPWHSEKEKLADRIDELTMLWMCGPDNREISHSKGVYSWRDKKCNSKTLGVKGLEKQKLLDRIIKINQHPTKLIDLGNLSEYQTILNFKNKLFVDFEVVTDVCLDIEGNTFESVLVFIGVGRCQNGKWNYTSFKTTSISIEEEKRICLEFLDYVSKAGKDSMLLHWSPYEPTTWKKTISKWGGSSKLNWVDLMDIFRKSPIVIKGCFAFGLKEVAGALHTHGYIPEIWTNSFPDGFAAMINLAECLTSNADFNKIIEYNEMDCKVLYHIVNFLSKNNLKEKI